MANTTLADEYNTEQIGNVVKKSPAELKLICAIIAARDGDWQECGHSRDQEDSCAAIAAEVQPAQHHGSQQQASAKRRKRLVREVNHLLSGKLVVGFLVSWLGAASPAMSDGITSIWDGIYTKAQAERGKRHYFEACVSCHGASLQGDDDNPDLVGTPFLMRWSGRPVSALIGFVADQMPLGRAGSLGDQGYADVVAYILYRNGVPYGAAELPARGAGLDELIIKAYR